MLVPLKDFGHHWHVWVPNATATKWTEVSVGKMFIWILNVKSSNISVIVSCRLYKSSSGEKDSQKNRSTVEKAATDMSSNYNALIKVSIMRNNWYRFLIVTCKRDSACLQSYQEQLKETKAQREELRTEIQRLKEDLESRLITDFCSRYYWYIFLVVDVFNVTHFRPTVKELKTCKQQLRRLDRIIQQSNIR